MPCITKALRGGVVYRTGRLNSTMIGQHSRTFCCRVSWCWHVWGHEPSDPLPARDLVTLLYLLWHFTICCRKYSQASPCMVELMIQIIWNGISHTPFLLWHRKQNDLPCHAYPASCEERVLLLHLIDSHDTSLPPHAKPHKGCMSLGDMELPQGWFLLYACYKCHLEDQLIC